MQKAVIFDMDGVILNSIPTHYRSLRDMFKEIGIDYSFQEFVRNDVTAGSMNLIPRVLKEHGKKGDAAALLRRKEKLLKKNIQMFAGVKQLIILLRKDGYKLAVGSGGSRRFVHLMLKKHKLKKYFPVVVTGSEARQKPHPDIYVKAAKKLGLRPSQCVVIEDSKNGVTAAHRAGMKVIGHKVAIEKQDLKKADKVVKSMKINTNMIEKMLKGSSR